MSHVVRAEALNRQVGQRSIVSEASLALRKGESVALFGPSGSGKTTLLQMIGLLDRPSAGSVYFGDDPDDAWAYTATARSALRLATIGFVFQQHHLLDQLSARDNVALPAWRLGGSRADALARADELLEAVGLKSRADARAIHLSVGEAQRVAIARALVNAPPLILADEPTGSLDSVAGARALEAVLAARDRGAALLIVTHDESIAARTDRVLRMHDGRLTES
jgi:ABC-type lipoprotein export system ATPase subunit